MDRPGPDQVVKPQRLGRFTCHGGAFLVTESHAAAAFSASTPMANGLMMSLTRRGVPVRLARA